MEQLRRKKIVLLIGIPISFIAGFFLHPLVFSDFQPRCDWRTVSYTNPELDCINTEAVFSEIHERELKVKEYVESVTKLKRANRVGVFFRDLKTRRWFGINHADNFSPGSLLKLPLAVAFYKLAEIDERMLSQELEYKASGASLNDLEFFKRSEPLVSDKKYSVMDLIERMIKDSDNEVLPTLISALPEGYYEKVLLDLGIRIPSLRDGGIRADFFSPSSNAAVLRSLYNSSYLNVAGSRTVLEILTRSSFNEGLVAGLPDGTLIAHKFGEGIAVDPVTHENIKLELHACGIVYKNDAPYILCVMTEGSDFKDLSKVISDISRIIWSN
jgi:hypothetical protein